MSTKQASSAPIAWARRIAVCVLPAILAASTSIAHAAPPRVEDAVPINTVDPVIAPTVYQGGTVVLRVTVRADGSVARVEVVKEFPALTEPVVQAVRAWQFKPATMDGRPIASTTTVAVHVALVRAVVGRGGA